MRFPNLVAMVTGYILVILENRESLTPQKLKRIRYFNIVYITCMAIVHAYM